MYAIIQTGGKQYLVEEGARVEVEKIPGKEEGDQVVLDEVLFLRNDGDTMIGRPYLEDASVSGEVVEKGKQEKVVVYKYKKRKGYRKKKGHRQPYMEIKVNSIVSEN